MLDAKLEQILQQTLQTSEDGGVGFEPGLIERLQHALIQTADEQEAAGLECILLVAAPIRPWLARFAKQTAPSVKVLSYNEVPDDRQIKVIATIGKVEA